ncbi:MAG: OmpA family protein [Bacteroidales bacterium]|nr:OmpA family protein [Bacteroidales bacterium]
MKSIKKLLAVAFAASLATAPAMAQDTEDNGLDYKPFPHMFVSVQGGGQTTFTNYDQLKLITPTASVGFGAWFTPVVGARLHVNGIWNKGGIKSAAPIMAVPGNPTVGDPSNGPIPGVTPAAIDQKYDYRYATTDLDLMINLVTLFGKKSYYPVNLYLIGGIGLNTAWDNGDAYAQKDLMPFAWKGKRLSHNARVGAQLDVNLHKNVSMNLEVAANSLSDRYNSKVNAKDDWQVTAQLGLAFKFGYKAKPAPAPKPEPVVEEVWETRIDTTWYDDVTYKDVVKDGDIDKRIFFVIRESDVESTDAQIEAVANFLKEVQNGEITITAYADKGTGNPKLNMGYSKARAEKTKAALIAKGVDPSIIKSVEWKGDTVQPYPNDNDKNRVSIITGHGVYKQQEKVVTKKFKTSERRVRVQ